MGGEVRNPMLLQGCCLSNSLTSNKNDTSLAPSALCMCPSTGSNSEEKEVFSLVSLKTIKISSLVCLYLGLPIYHPLNSSPSENELLFNVDFCSLMNLVMDVELGVTMSDKYC